MSNLPKPRHSPATPAAERVRIGVGGWTFKPWRKHFHPPGLPQQREMEYASRRLTAIEVNGTCYSSFKPEGFRQWHNETPADFVLSLKAPLYAANRRVLAQPGESITRFIDSWITELGN